MKVRYLEKGLELYDSISFLALGLGPSEVVMGEGDETLKLILDFKRDDSSKTTLEWKVNDNTSITATLTNWSEPLGTTLVEPVSNATLLNREMTFIFSVRKVGSEGEVREVMISVYLGGEVNDG